MTGKPADDRDPTDPRAQYIVKMPGEPAPRDVDSTPPAGIDVPPVGAVPDATQRIPGGYPGAQVPGPYSHPLAQQAPPAPEPRRSGRVLPIAVMLLALAAVAGVYLFTRGAGSGRDASPTPTLLPTTSSASATSATSTGAGGTAGTDAPSSATATDGAVSLPEGSKECGPGVGASPTTTCQFALAVATGARGRGPEAFEVRAHSTTTNLDYTMSCSGRPLSICRGGRAAVVYVANP